MLQWILSFPQISREKYEIAPKFTRYGLSFWRSVVTTLGQSPITPQQIPSVFLHAFRIGRSLTSPVPTYVQDPEHG